MTHPDMRIEGRIVGVRSTEQSYPIFAYRGIIIPLLCSYEQAHVGLDLLTLASLYKTLNEKSICG